MKMLWLVMMMCAKKFLTNDELEDIDPASEYENIVADVDDGS